MGHYFRIMVYTSGARKIIVKKCSLWVWKVFMWLRTGTTRDFVKPVMKIRCL